MPDVPHRPLSHGERLNNLRINKRPAPIVVGSKNYKAVTYGQDNFTSKNGPVKNIQPAAWDVGAPPPTPLKEGRKLLKRIQKGEFNK